MEMTVFIVSKSILSLIVYHWRAGYYPFAESLKIIRIICGGGFSKFTTMMSNFSAKFATMFLVSESILSLTVYDWRAGYNPFAESLKLIRISCGDGFSKFSTRCQTLPSLSPLLSPMKHRCVFGFGCGCGCGTRQFLKKLGCE